MEPSVLNSSDLQIVRLIGLGCPRKAIADELAMNPKTLEFRIAGMGNNHSLFKKLGACRDADIMRYALAQGMVKAGEKWNGSTPKKPTGPPVKMEGIEGLKSAMLKGAALAASGQADVLQLNGLCQCSDAYIRLVRVQMEARRLNQDIGV